MGLAVMLCHTPGGMPVIPEERLRCSTSYSVSVVCRRWKPSLGRIEESLEEVEKIPLPSHSGTIQALTSEPTPPQKEEAL
jgi:hypothetical protein